jgi:hypothetical protein
VVKDLELITETNSQKVKTVNTGDSNSIVLPLNIYFKMNALDPNQSGLNYQYINLNNSQKTVKHIKKVKFLNRNKVIIKKTTQATNIQVK